MGRARWRAKVFLGVVVVVGAGGGLAIACGSDDATGGSCSESSCDGGFAESSALDTGSGGDGSPTSEGGGDSAADADAAMPAACVGGGPPGTLDTSFGEGGLVWLKYPGGQAFAVAAQPDGKIVVAGGLTRVGAPTVRKFAVVRLLLDGTPDPTFGTAGLVETVGLSIDTQPLRAMAIQPDGKIVVAGPAIGPGPTSYDFVVLRYNPNGTLDTTFGNAGATVTDFGNTDDYPRSMAIQPDGRILVVGYSETNAVNSTGNIVVARYDTDGILDDTFGTGGRATIDVRGTQDLPAQCALLAGGKFSLAASVKAADGTHYELAVLRRNGDGSADTTFGSGGVFLSALGGGMAGATSPILQSPNRLLVGGSRDSDFALVGLAPAGGLDPTFGTGGLVVTDFSGREDAIVASVLFDEGKITAVGNSQDPVQSATRGIALSRYHPNGVLDTNFGSSGRTLTLPPPDADLDARAAVRSGCSTVVVGSWIYNESAITQLAMGIARYRR